MTPWRFLLAPLFVLPACAGQGAGEQGAEEQGMWVTLDAQGYEASLDLPARDGDRLLVEVRPSEPAPGGTLSIFAEGSQAPLARFTPYPPDLPGRVAVVVPPEVTRLRVRFDPARQGAPAVVAVRVVVP